MSVYSLAYLSRQVDRRDKEIRRLRGIVWEYHNYGKEACDCEDCKAEIKNNIKKVIKIHQKYV